MKQTNILAGISLLVLLLPSMAHSQSKAPASVTGTASGPMTMAALQNARIRSVELNGVDSTTALTRLMATVRVGYDFAPEFYRSVYVGGGQGVLPKASLNLPQRTITMRLENVRVTKALDSLTKAIGIRWVAESDDDGVIIHFLPLPTTNRELPIQVGSEGGGGLGGGFGGGGFGGGGFSGGFNRSIGQPTARVKLDVRDTPVRTALKTLFDQQKPETGNSLSFAVDEDVAPDLKVSLMFENAHLTTALDVLCQTAGLGWRTEGTPNGLLIRVSKRYAEPDASP
ncbi:MAG: hypothetical protein SFU56_18800 [Capsulimonadales bacterium]|nr:hypothetical protein [Capsulimonadales bacterium]